MMKHIKTVLLSALLVLTIAGCSNQATQEDAASQPSGSAPASSSSIAESSTSESSTDVNSADANSADVNSANENSTDVNSADVNRADENSTSESSASEAVLSTFEATSSTASTPAPSTPAAGNAAGAAAPATSGALTVHFGDDGVPFTMHLYDNSTAAAIASYVGTADWRLPINEFDGYDNWEVMQYYDLPSRYEIPSNAVTVSSEKSGQVYYSEPNRIVLFYGDAAVTGEYTPIGYFDATADFVTAVSDNPVLEGWGNKIVLIKD